MQDIPGYEIIEKLGEGGMGVVYKARQLSLNRLVALKVLREGLDMDADAVARFLREGEAAARLEHDNIVHIFDAHLQEPPYYIAMQLLKGHSARGRLQPEKAVAIVKQVCLALDAVHREGIIHRDIKPANIMVDSTGKATLTDFGIARLVDQAGLTGTGAFIGSPPYMSPEQVSGAPVDYRTDLYSAGCVLYELLTGRPPFVGSNVTIISQILNQPPTPPQDLIPDLSSALQRVVLHAMEKDSRNRYQSGAEMAAAMEAALRATGADDGPTVVIPPGPKLGESKEPPLWKRPLVMAAVVCVALVMAGIAMLGVHTTQASKVPNVVGKTENSAKSALEAVGLECHVASREYSEAVAKDRILRQDPKADDDRPRGARVEVVLSLGPPPISPRKVVTRPPAIVYVCDLCRQGFPSKAALLRHKGKAHPVQPYANQPIRVKRTKVLVSQPVPARTQPPAQPQTPKAEVYKCSVCGQEFASKTERNRHESICQVANTAETLKKTVKSIGGVFGK